MSERNFFAELKRRNVYKVAVAYAVVSWLLIQIATQVFPFFEVPNWAVRLVVLLLALGFPVALVLSWAFEITPEGIKLESEVVPDEKRIRPGGRRTIGITIALALVAAGLLAFQLLQSRLANLSHGEPDVPLASIAVLPFTDMSQAKDQEYFADGISEELLNLLAKIPQLQVTARTSSFAFKGKETGIPEIARTLHVAHVLEGSVRKAGNSVRITVQLIKASTDTHLWSQTYDRKLDDIFAIQDEIAADVVKQLKVTLLGEGPKSRTTDPEAYAFYLQAVQLGRLRTAEAYEQSAALYQKVLAIDPRYAPAWGGLASNFANKVNKHEKDAPYNIAYVYAFRGEADKAFEWLDKAIEYGDSGLADVVSENLFDKIHSDPRWLPFLRKIGKAPEQLAQIKFKVTLPK